MTEENKTTPAPITEGIIKKGGVSAKPLTERPEAPKGLNSNKSQADSASDSSNNSSND